MYRHLSKEFNECHQSPANVLIHLLTTPAFYFCIFGILRLCGLSFIMVIYATTLLFIPGKLSKTLSLLTLLAGFFVAEIFESTLIQSLALFTISYLVQDLAHFATCEPTFQYRYTPTTAESNVKTWQSFFLKLSLHTYFMLPLVFDAAYEISLPEQVLSWFLVLDRIIKLKLHSKESLRSLKVIKEWLDGENLADDVTTHLWFSSLNPEIKQAFQTVAHDESIFKAFNEFFPGPTYKTVALESMNEVYVAAVENNQATSDNVFYSNHVDGPWMCYPFVSVYRAIVAVNGNDFIKTIFPAQPVEKVLSDGDLWAFDFNREVHRIQCIKTPKAKRYTLKLHYLVYPTNLSYFGYFLGFATSVYDTIARLAFVKTLSPSSFLEHILWAIIMIATRLFYGSIRAAGNSGAISFLLLTGIILYFTKTTVPLFMISSSFIHYFIYISTYYHYETHKRKVMFDGFKKTVMFYKAVAFYHLLTNYVSHSLSIDYISLAMIAFGFSLSGCAAAAIGIDQTYFGAELGRIKPNRISTFPYNITHHPMIIGNIIGLLGFHKSDGFRNAFPWLVPVHIFFYTIHMLQEHFDIKKNVVKESLE